MLSGFGFLNKDLSTYFSDGTDMFVVDYIWNDIQQYDIIWTYLYIYISLLYTDVGT